MSSVASVSSNVRSLLLFIFFLSGFAALVYQVAWQRLLTVYYGVGSISVTLIVSVYMFGLGLGALLGGRIAEQSHNRIRLYFIIELLIGCFGAISVPFLNFLGQYTAGSSHIVSLAYMFLFLSIPTILMGITLPLLTKIFNRIINNFLETVSFLYFINTIGAALGSVFASYIVISFFGLDNAVYVAVVINFILAALIFSVKSSPVQKAKVSGSSGANVGNNEDVFGNMAYFFVVITGFLAIGYEIVWFRVIGIIVKSSPYAFSSVLSVYLLGIALGSLGMKNYLSKFNVTDKKSLFFLLQALIGLSVIIIIASYYYLTLYTPLGAATRYSFNVAWHPYFNLSFESLKSFLGGLYSILDVFMWPVLFLFIPTLLIGSSFPLISSLALKDSSSDGKTIGTVYFFNILGNVLGGIVTGFILLPIIGTELTLLIFSVIGLLFGFFVKKVSGFSMSISKRAVMVVATIVVAVMIFPAGGELYKAMHVPPDEEHDTYFEEGVAGVVMTYENKEKEKVWNFINGVAHGARPEYMFYYEAAEAISYAQKVENALVIGYGTGSIVEMALKMDSLKKLKLVEINDALIKNLSKMDIFRDMLSDKRIDLVIDDGRRVLLNTDDKYDLIMIDPLRSTSAYSNNIYSKQFFELVKARLSPGGIFMVWRDEYRVLPKTVLAAFDYTKTYSFFSLASNQPMKQYESQRQKIMSTFSEEGRRRIAKWTDREWEHTDDLEYIENLVKDYPINEDWKPVAEYYLGLQFREKFLMK